MAARIGQAVLELSTDNAQFNQGLDAAGKKVLAFDGNITAVRGRMDALVKGLSIAGQQASASGQMIAGMGQAGLQAAADLAKAAAPLDELARGLSVAGQQASASGQMIAGMSDIGRTAIQQLGQTSTRSLSQITQAFDSPIDAAKTLAATLVTQVAEGGFGSVTLGAAAAATGFGALVGAMVEMTVHWVDLGEEIQNAAFKMSDTAEKTSALKSGLEVAGGTIDQAANLLFKMNGALEEGGPAADKVRQGLAAIGLSVEQVEALSPADQFLAIADAFRKNTDQTNRSGVAMELFARQGRDAIPLLMKPIGDLVQQQRELGNVMSTDDVQAAEELGRAWRQLEEDVKWAFVKPVAFLFDAVTLRGNRPAVDELHGAISDLGDVTLQQGDDTVFSTAQMKAWDDQVKKNLDDATKHAEAIARAAAKEQEAFARTIEKMRDMVAWGSSVTKSLGELAVMGTHSAGLIADSFDQAQQKMAKFTAVDPKAFKYDLSALFKMGTITPPSMEDFKPIAKTLTATFDDAFKSLPTLFVKAFTGGGGMSGALNAFGAKIGSSLFSVDQFDKVTGKLTAAGSTIGNSLAKLLPTAFADAIPGIGALIGPGISALVGGIKKLFGGPSQQELEGRGVEKTFQDSFAGFDDMLGKVNDAYLATGRTSEQARQDVDRLMKAEQQGGAAVQAVIDQINGVFAEQAAQWDAVQESVGNLNAFTQEGIDTQGKFNLAAASTVAIFDAWVKKTGDVAGALDQIGPSLDTLAAGETDLGFAGNAAIDQLLGMRKVTEANKPLMDGIGQSTMLFTSLGKAGLLTADLVTGFGQTAVNEFTLMKQATGNETEAMALMQPELQQLWEHQQKFHDITDQATLALLNQAQTSGVVGEDMQSDNDKLLEVMKQIRDVLADATGQAGRFAKAIDQIPTHHTTTIDVVQGAMPAPDTGGSDSGGAQSTTLGPGHRFGTPNLDYLDFGRESFVPLHGMEAVIPQSAAPRLAQQIAAAMGGTGSGDLSALVAAVQEQTALLRAGRVTSVQIDGRELIQATHRVLLRDG